GACNLWSKHGGADLKIPIISNGLSDRRGWFHNPHGYYTSKSAYSWLLLKQVGHGPHRFFWGTIWKLKTLPKIRIFCWRVAHDILPTYQKISSIHQEFKKDCLRCRACDETLIHALKDCPTAREILVLGGLNNNLLVGDFSQCIDWIEDLMRVLDLKTVSDFITTLWNSWNNRNNFIFRGKEDEARVVWERAVTLCHDFRIHNLVNKPLLPVSLIEKSLMEHPHDTMKINFDAAVSSKKMGYGMIARDSDGFVLGGGVIDMDMHAEWAELKALEESLNFARAFNFHKVQDITLLGYCTDVICKQLENFNSSNVIWANRCCNKITDYLCKQAIVNHCNLTFKLDYPLDIHDLVMKDLIN
ncbi:hypothetical protein Gotur_012113, partial [Gossypium turneri]